MAQRLVTEPVIPAYIFTFTDGSHRFWCDGVQRGWVSGCNILKRYYLQWDEPYLNQPMTVFDHYPTVEECEEEFREMRKGIGVDPMTGLWPRQTLNCG